MMNSSSFKDADRHVPVRIDYSRARQKYARGGLAKQAENVRQSGRMGDDMVVHVNKREFDEMCQRWGKPTVNPKTGMPEFFLGDLFSGLGNLVTSGSSYIPVVGESVSGWLGSNPGVAQAIGSGLLGAGAGQLLGGNTKSTLIGAGLGALAPTFLGGASLFGGAGATGGRGFGDASVPGVAAKDIPMEQAAQDFAKNGGGGGLFGNMSPDKKAMAGIIGALTIANMIGGARNSKPNAAQKAAEQANKQAQQQFNQPMPVMEFARAYNGYGGDPRLYGFGGANGMGNWFTNNQLPRRAVPIQGQLAKGGPVPKAQPPMGALAAMHVSGESPRYVQGPGGAREDKIPAMLSDGEYVLTAEEVSLLGDGSPQEGAKRLDEFRANLRRHKGGALAKGKISPDAKAPEQYMRKS